MSIVEVDVPHYNPTAPNPKANDRHLRSHGKIGDCEQYDETDESVIVESKDNLQSQKGIYVAFRRGGEGGGLRTTW